MTATLIGADYDGVQCVKIVKGNLNPVTEPDGNVGSFLFNSKWAADIKVQYAEKTPYAGGLVYTPSGSNVSTYQKVTYVGIGNQMNVAIKNSYFPDLPYQLPLYDLKIKRVADNKWIEVNRVRYQGEEDNLGREAAYWNTLDSGNSIWWLNYTHPFAQIGHVGNGIVFTGSVPGTDSTPFEKTVVVWRLPGNNVPILDGAPLPPVVGQDSIRISDTGFRVAKPGYDVDTATATQLAFDSANRPASIIAGADISLPIGTTEYELNVAVPNSTVLDLYLYDSGGSVIFPMSPENGALVAEYWFSGTKLFISNAVRACRARFIVLAFDGAPPTSGPNDVLRQFSSGGQNVMQILKPGAANNPSFSDIILDSRWPALQILKEGYLPVAAVANRNPQVSNAGVSQTVTFPNAGGVFPIVKYMTVHNDASQGLCVRPPQTRVIENYNNSTVYQSGYSTYCVLGSNQATFWTFNGNPYLERWTSSWQYDYPPDPIVGIRYYILGIPS